MVNNGASPTVANCVFRDNTAQSYGGGMYNLGGAAPAIVNCIFEFNSAGLGGGGMANNGASASNKLNGGIAEVMSRLAL